MPDATYILGDEADELDRLRRQHEVWSGETQRLLRRAGFSRGQTLIDVGCGPGLTTFDLHRTAGAEGRVLAMDSSPRMIEALNREMVARRIENVTGVLQDVERLGEGLVEADGALARWVLCFVNDPAAVVQGVARLLKKGGSFVVMDYFNYRAMTLQPADGLFDRVFQAVFDSFENAGGGLEVGRRVPQFMASAGLQVEHVEPICGIGRPGTGLWNWVTDFTRGYLPKLVERGLLRPAELEDFSRFWAAVAQRPDAFLFVPPMIGVIGTRR